MMRMLQLPEHFLGDRIGQVFQLHIAVIAYTPPGKGMLGGARDSRVPTCADST